MFISLFKGKDKDVSFQLSNNRFITVSEFRGKTRVDIREFYLNDDGEKKPGKKGISLSLQEWEKLKELTSKIDKAAKANDLSSGDSDSDSVIEKTVYKYLIEMHFSFIGLNIGFPCKNSFQLIILNVSIFINIIIIFEIITNVSCNEASF